MSKYHSSYNHPLANEVELQVPNPVIQEAIVTNRLQLEKSLKRLYGYIIALAVMFSVLCCIIVWSILETRDALEDLTQAYNSLATKHYGLTVDFAMLQSTVLGLDAEESQEAVVPDLREIEVSLEALQAADVEIREETPTFSYVETLVENGDNLSQQAVFEFLQLSHNEEVEVVVLDAAITISDVVRERSLDGVLIQTVKVQDGTHIKVAYRGDVYHLVVFAGARVLVKTTEIGNLYYEVYDRVYDYTLHYVLNVETGSLDQVTDK